MDYDVIVIGSGLAALLLRVASPSRLQSLDPGTGTTLDKTTYRECRVILALEHECPNRRMAGLTCAFPNIGVVQGAAVGGGSLIYANISCERRQNISGGWPKKYLRELKPHYDAVASS